MTQLYCHSLTILYNQILNKFCVKLELLWGEMNMDSLCLSLTVNVNNIHSVNVNNIDSGKYGEDVRLNKTCIKP